jgi:hypothetical protein
MTCGKMRATPDAPSVLPSRLARKRCHARRRLVHIGRSARVGSERGMSAIREAGSRSWDSPLRPPPASRSRIALGFLTAIVVGGRAQAIGMVITASLRLSKKPRKSCFACLPGGSSVHSRHLSLHRRADENQSPIATVSSAALSDADYHYRQRLPARVTCPSGPKQSHDSQEA